MNRSSFSRSLPSMSGEHRTPLPLCLSAAVLASVLLASPAHADTQTCDFVQRDLILVDGMLDDWSGIGKFRVGGRDSDASFTLRCVYDDKRIFLSIRVTDDFLYRQKKPSARKDDHVRVAFSAAGKSAGTLVVFPGTDKVKPKRTWNGKAVPKWLEAEDGLQRRGWSLEASIPLARLRGLGKGSPGVGARIEYRDADFAAKTERTIAFDGLLEFQASAALFQSFLKTTGLKRKDIRLDKLANINDQPGPERVIVGGKLIGVLTDRFTFMELPVRSARDIAKVQIAALRGDGTRSLITQYREHGNGGSRDVVAIWQLGGGGSFERLFAVEVRKQLGDKVLVNRWSLKPRKRKGRKGKGKNLVIEVTEADARGWDEDNYAEAPARDVKPILTPWSDQTSAVYRFEGNAVLGGDPLPRARKRRR